MALIAAASASQPSPPASPSSSRQLSSQDVGSLGDVRQLLADAEALSALSPSGVVGLATRVAHLWASGEQSLLDASLLADVVPSCYGLLHGRMDAMQPAQFADAAVAMCQLRHRNTELLKSFAEAARPGFGSIPADGLAALTASLADAGVRPSQGWLGALMSHVQGRLSDISGGSHAQLLWALVRLGVRPTGPWLGGFVEANGQRLRSMQASDLALLARALSDISFAPPSEWAGAYLDTVGDRLSSGAGASAPGRADGGSNGLQDGSCRVAPGAADDGSGPMGGSSSSDSSGSGSSSCQAGGSQEADAFQPGSSSISSSGGGSSSSQQADAFQPGELVDLAAGLSRLRLALPPAFGRSLLSATQAALPRMRSADLCSLAATVSSLRLSPSGEWVGALMAHALAVMPQMGPREVMELLPAVVAMRQAQLDGGSAGGHAAWMAALIDSCRFKLTRFTAQSLPRLIECIAEAGTRPDAAWLSAFSDVAHSKADVLSASDMAALDVCLCFRLGHLPRGNSHQAQLARQLSLRAPALDGPLLTDTLCLLAQLGATLQSLHGLDAAGTGAAAGAGAAPVSAATTEQQTQQAQAQQAHQHQTQQAQQAQAQQQRSRAAGAAAARAWRSAVLSSSQGALPSLSNRQVGELAAAAVKLELHPPVTWVQSS
ncbi:hypothetical protein FOA52_015688 [Chlamydomonas sp. UWO 241]|nr:hypothetical protein FOA52_015688 [Chlamydomonas sp. UWO 241]